MQECDTAIDSAKVPKKVDVSVKEYLQKASGLQKQGFYDSAFVFLKGIMPQSADSMLIKYAIGDLLLNWQSHSDGGPSAAAHFKQLLNSDSLSIPALVGYAFAIYIENPVQNVQTSLRLFEKAECKEPACVQIYTRRAFLWIREREKEQARGDIEKARLYGLDCANYYLLTAKMHESGKTAAECHFDSAFHYYSKALACDSLCVFALEGRAMLCNDPRKSIADFTKAIKICPNSASLYYNRGMVYKSMNLHDLAMADLVRARSIDSSFCRFAY